MRLYWLGGLVGPVFPVLRSNPAPMVLREFPFRQSQKRSCKDEGTHRVAAV